MNILGIFFTHFRIHNHVLSTAKEGETLWNYCHISYFGCTNHFWIIHNTSCHDNKILLEELNMFPVANKALGYVFVSANDRFEETSLNVIWPDIEKDVLPKLMLDDDNYD